MRRIDLTGQRFGSWAVHHYEPGKPYSAWLCTCDCGTERLVNGAYLRSGKSKSCGICTRAQHNRASAHKRDFSGAKNPRARKARAMNGSAYMASSDVWYKRASGVFYAAKRNGVPIGFSTAMEFATYVKSIAPEVCPVFGKPFEHRGGGFQKMSPSIDKIVPERGYVRGNVQVISLLANKMKQDASIAELKQFAAWVENAL